MVARADVDELNKEFYGSRLAADWYAAKEFVLPEEKVFLDAFGNEIRAARLLDIGIGAGRSTRFLLPLAREYTGVDYSADMIEAARPRFPGANLAVRDARDLSAYGDGAFDAVIFSFNGMDCLSHEGRMLALAEMRRVLRPGGLLGFSSHNRERPAAKPYALKFLNRSKHPVRMLRHLREYIGGIRSWRRSRACAVSCAEYELRHDCGNFFRAPTYFISKTAQAAQCARLGFELLVIYDGTGRETQAGEPDAESSWIFYACRKPA